ncbi:hypothetical protein Taro_042733 [Colocasia esculenta]|uniref:Uncharacterized protein n=1 Tax=Colocasia esculenta TaxID=4460 RepID=A0A843WEN7_COLES|nr:hypothetical protein [Colocasia esculenta]
MRMQGCDAWQKGPCDHGRSGRVKMAEVELAIRVQTEEGSKGAPQGSRELIKGPEVLIQRGSAEQAREGFTSGDFREFCSEIVLPVLFFFSRASIGLRFWNLFGFSSFCKHLIQYFGSLFGIWEIRSNRGSASLLVEMDGMKRWGFSGMPASHGASLSHRSIGSTGQRDAPGKAIDDTQRKALQSVVLHLWHITCVKGEYHPHNGTLLYELLRVPGAEGNFVFVKDAVYKKPDISLLPFPTCFIPEGEETSELEPLVADLGEVDPFMAAD